MNRVLVTVFVVAAHLPGAARAFPPYRSTDAGTADPWTLEGRLGFFRVAVDDGEQTWSSPLLRLNFGFPHRLELLSELEVRPADREVADAAIGIKWIPVDEEAASLGFEALALLPVSQAGGAGIESQLAATYRLDPVRIHVNVGAFYDAREDPAEVGLRAGVITEARFGRLRPGVELFAKRLVAEPLQLQAGAGLIVSLGPIDLRAGVHAGLTRAAPDVVASLWISTAVPLRRE